MNLLANSKHFLCDLLFLLIFLATNLADASPPPPSPPPINVVDGDQRDIVQYN